MKMHPSICDAGVQPNLEECNTCCRKLFHCPLCPTFKPTTRRKINRHVDAHMKNGIKYKDKHLLKCRLSCRAEGHFHCPFCQKTVIRRIDMEKHLCLCQVSLNTLPSVTSVSCMQTPLLVKQPASTSFLSMHAPLSEESLLPMPASPPERDQFPPLSSPARISSLSDPLPLPTLPSAPTLVQPSFASLHALPPSPLQSVPTSSPPLTAVNPVPLTVSASYLSTSHPVTSLPVESSFSSMNAPPPATPLQYVPPPLGISFKCMHVPPSTTSHQSLNVPSPSNTKLASVVPPVTPLPSAPLFVHVEHSYASPPIAPNGMPSLRKWWCLLLMENFELDRFGKIFAHWTEESNAVLQGHHVSVSRLRKRKLAEVDQEPAVVRDLFTAVKWITQNRTQLRGHVTMPRYFTKTEEDRKYSLIELLKGDGPETKEPFMFQFENQDDMELFLQACVDKQGLRVNAMFLLNV